MTGRLLSAVCIVVASGIASACASDAPLAPPTSSVTTEVTDLGRLAAYGDTKTVIVLARSRYLAEDVSVSALIGPEGGSIEIQEAGGKIEFPAGALAEPTTITMTAKAGWNVAYEFEPHGIIFDKPVTIEQHLKCTVARGKSSLKTLQAGYYRQDLEAIFVDSWRSLARVSELRDADLDSPDNPHIATFFIYHFSGYIMSSGFAPGGGADSTDAQF